MNERAMAVSPSHLALPTSSPRQIGGAKQGASRVTGVRGLTVADSRWLFVGLCLYVLSQSITVPLLALGPWALWPNLSDLAVGFMCVAYVFTPRRPNALPAINSRVFRGLLIIVVGCLISYVVSTLFVNLISVQFGAGERLVYGLHTMGRLFEFLIVFGLISIIPLSNKRVRILSVLSSFVLIFVCVAIIGTYFGTIKTSTFVKSLPQGRDVAGQWDNYRMNYGHEGLGTIGYNHHYVAAQVVLLLGLWIALNPRSSFFRLAVMLALSTFAIFFTGSRSVLGAELLLVGILIVRRSVKAPVLIGLVAALLFIAPGVVSPSPGPKGQESEIVQRQSSTLRFYEEENLSGREDIWHAKLSTLIENPQWWLLGHGLGSSVDTGEGTSAHMMPLQILIETGAIGFVSIFGLIIALLWCLWNAGAHSQPVFWVTVALLITSASYETFYPIPSMGQFLGLFLCIVAVSLRLDSQEQQETAREPVSTSRRSFFAGTSRPAPRHVLGQA
jgi:O-antigen ligase